MTPLAARVAWSRLAEPGDVMAGVVVATLGPVAALEWLRDAVAGAPAAVGPASVRQLSAAVRRWAPRLQALDPDRELAVLARLGGTLLTPETPGWPAGLDDLGPAAPHCLWVRGVVKPGPAVAVIGSRACTPYGEHVAAELAAGLADAGMVVVSGGAYGIDAAAHRGALAAGGPTVAFLAGGVDRLYPAGNSHLLETVLERGGAIVSEVPPGSVPSRVRFLLRNRLIAAVSRATVVVEAAWRSGALSTAGHAETLLRPVAAVPGPVTSAASAGCHRLLRQGAICVTDCAEVLELVGGEPAPEPDAARPEDGLGIESRRMLDALPLRRPAGLESLCRAAGLGVAEARAALGHLELRGLALRVGEGWRRPA